MNSPMNANIRTPIILTTTFALGGVAGFFIAKKLLQEHYREIAQLEIDEVTSYFKEKYESPKDEEKHRKLIDKYTKPSINSVVNHSADIYVDEDKFNEIDEDELEELEYDEEDEEEEHDGPYLISYGDFLDKNSEYEKVDLFYYRFDDILCNVEDVIIHEPEEVLGWEWRKRIERRSAAFIRDDDMMVDYEIHALSKSYNDEVAIRLETNKEKQYRRTARQKEAMDAFSAEEYERDEEKKPKTKPYVRPKNQKIKYHNIVEETKNND